MSVEGYPDDWARVELIVSPNGLAHAISGDRTPGEGDQPYIGLERIKQLIDRWREEVVRLEDKIEALQMEECSEPCPKCGGRGGDCDLCCNGSCTKTAALKFLRNEVSLQR